MSFCSSAGAADGTCGTAVDGAAHDAAGSAGPSPGRRRIIKFLKTFVNYSLYFGNSRVQPPASGRPLVRPS